jgi:hypothetical protein
MKTLRLGESRSYYTLVTSLRLAPDTDPLILFSDNVRHSTCLAIRTRSKSPSSKRPYTTRTELHVSPRLVNLILIRALTSEKIHGTDYLHVRFYTAGWQNMTPPRYEQVLDDCDKALKLDPA